VAAAVGGGVVFSTTKSGISCDVNADDDTTPAADDGLDLPVVNDDAFEVVIPDTDFGSGADGDGFVGGDAYGDGGDGSASAGGDDPIDSQGDIPLTVPPGGPSVGDAITVPQICENQTVRWFRGGQPIPGITGDMFNADLPDAGLPISAIIECNGEEYETEEVTVNPYFAPGTNLSFDITSNDFGTNSCVDGSQMTPGAPGPTGNHTHSGSGVGYRIVRGSSFVAQVCGTVGSNTLLPGTGIQVNIVFADGSSVPVFTGTQSRVIVATPGNSSTYFSGFFLQGISNFTVT